MDDKHRAMIVTRALTKKEFYWLDEDIPKGTVVYRFSGATYGCIGPGGAAICMSPETNSPFIEVPASAIRPH